MRRAQPPLALDAFAELLSEGHDPRDIARALGYANPKQGNALLQRLRKRMGAQAV